MNTNTTLTDQLAERLRSLNYTANRVTANWESGDLAGAVRNLDEAAEEAQQLLQVYEAARVQ